MKKLTLIALLATVSLVGDAQEETTPNKFVLGGAMNFLVQHNSYPFAISSFNSSMGGLFSNNTDDSKYTSFSFSPYVGKEINPHFIVGFQLSYLSTMLEVDNASIFGQPDLVDYEYNSNQIGIGIFSRHTLNPDKQFQLFIQPNIEYNFVNEEQKRDSNVTDEEKAGFLELGIGVGALYNISDRVRATMRVGGLNYITGKWEVEGTETKKSFSSFGTNINLASLFFGLEIRI